MRPATRSRSGAALGDDRRVGKCGSKDVAADSARSHLVQAAVQPVAAVDSEQQESSENEVSTQESEEGDHDSSSDNSDFGCEDDEELVETGIHNPDLLIADGGLLADQVFDQMPQPSPTVPGLNLGTADNARVQVGTEGAAQSAPWTNLFKDNRNLGKGIKLDEWEVDGDCMRRKKKEEIAVKISLNQMKRL